MKSLQAKQKQYNSTSQLSNGMSNGMSNFGSKQKLYGSQPKIDSFAEELKQAVSYQSLNTVNEGIRPFQISRVFRPGLWYSIMTHNFGHDTIKPHNQTINDR